MSLLLTIGVMTAGTISDRQNPSGPETHPVAGQGLGQGLGQGEGEGKRGRGGTKIMLMMVMIWLIKRVMVVVWL